MAPVSLSIALIVCFVPAVYDLNRTFACEIWPLWLPWWEERFCSSQMLLAKIWKNTVLVKKNEFYSGWVSFFLCDTVCNCKEKLAIAEKKICNIMESAAFCRKVLEWQQLWGWVLQCQGVIAWCYVWGVCGVAKAFDGTDMSNVCVGSIAGCYVWFPLLSLLTLWQGKVSFAMSESIALCLCAIFLRYC